jgi:hypothetical protein
VIRAKLSGDPLTYQAKVQPTSGLLGAGIVQTLSGQFDVPFLLSWSHYVRLLTVRGRWTSLYPALHRLENRGWVFSRWGASENNRKAKFYRLTAAGRKQLVHETSRRRQMTRASAW